MHQICVFCGSNHGVRPAYAEAARAMGVALVRRGMGLVYGGGKVGLMGVLADAVLECGGLVTGVIPEAMVAKELAHRKVSDLRIVGSMHERKALMADLADAFVALPGGYGTLEEFCEVLTWSQLGLHEKPCGLLNVEGYYDSLLALLDHATREEFILPAHRELVQVSADADHLLELLLRCRPPRLEKWIERNET